MTSNSKLMTQKKHKAQKNKTLVPQIISRKCRLRQTRIGKIMTTHE